MIIDVLRGIGIIGTPILIIGMMMYAERHSDKPDSNQGTNSKHDR